MVGCLCNGVFQCFVKNIIAVIFYIGIFGDKTRTVVADNYWLCVIFTSIALRSVLYLLELYLVGRSYD